MASLCSSQLLSAALSCSAVHLLSCSQLVSCPSVKLLSCSWLLSAAQLLLAALSCSNKQTFGRFLLQSDVSAPRQTVHKAAKKLPVFASTPPHNLYRKRL